MIKQEITDNMTEELREKIKPYLNEKRYSHTLAVEREAVSLGKLFLPDDIKRLQAAALLHDITKKLSSDEHVNLCREMGIPVSDDDLAAPKTFHSKTGAALAERDFPAYTDEKIVSGIRWHTTGHREMDMFESIVYLADYIEETRTFDDCVMLRRFFYDGISGAVSESDRYKIFVKTMIKSFDLTIECLIEESSLIDRNTVEARNRFIKELRELEE